MTKLPHSTADKQTIKPGKASVQVQQSAAKIAAGIKKPGQTKEQTKLIEQGIQKGVELYKKQQKVKAREADKAKKQRLKIKSQQSDNEQVAPQQPKLKLQVILPWTLLIFSWLAFVTFLIVTGNI